MFLYVDITMCRVLSYSIENIFVRKDDIMNEFESWDWQMKNTSIKALMNTLLSNPTYDEENATD